MEERAWKRILRPSISKIAMFIILMLFISILPLYPTDYNSLSYYTGGQYPRDGSGISFQPLVFVLQGNFDWYERESNLGYTFNLGSWLYTDYHYMANPIFLVLYILFGFIAYCTGCFSVEYLKWWSKHNKNKGIKDL